MPLNVTIAMLEDLAKPKVPVQNARMVFIKMSKAKTNALNAHWENRTLMPKQHAMVVALVRLAAAKAFARNAQLDFTKIPKEKLSAVEPATQQKKYPTKMVPAVNCHHGAHAKKPNI